MTQIERMTNRVVKWIRQYIPDEDRDSLNTAIKLSDEVSELQHAIYTGDGDVASEVADCMILLLDIAYINEVDIEAAFAEKMRVNENRKWDKVMGALKHVKGSK